MGVFQLVNVNLFAVDTFFHIRSSKYLFFFSSCVGDGFGFTVATCGCSEKGNSVGRNRQQNEGKNKAICYSVYKLKETKVNIVTDTEW